MFEGKLFDLLVEKIVSEVIKRVNSRAKRALVLFTGAKIGFNESMNELLEMKKNGWQLKVVLSDDAMNVLDPEAIKKELNLDKIYHRDNIESQRDLYTSVDLMIVGTMSINTAAKLAVGITDTVLLSLINHGFMAGIPLVAAKNACNPDDPRRIELGMGKSTAMYRKMLLSNMDKLKEFGMVLVEAKELECACDKGFVAKAIPGDKKEESLNQDKKEHLPVTSPLDAITFDKKVVSRTDILKVRDAKIIKVPVDAIVTEYAIEAIDSFGLQMIRI